jgi:hypothetical protein
VRDALAQSNLRDVRVSRVEPATFHLTGTVETLADRLRAEELAAGVVGAAGDVRNEIDVTGLGPLQRGDTRGPAPVAESGDR